ncbi:MAG: hypothetical protein ACP5VS_14735 [Desulfomonilaceae bacterium]
MIFLQATVLVENRLSVMKIKKLIFTFLVILASMPFMGIESPNAQYPGQPPGPPMGYATPQTSPYQQQQQPLEYAFRPDLTNPEYGECLNLEKRWKALYQSYYSAYSQASMLNLRDPQYAQMANYVNGMKAQMDAAWASFSGRCVYFPKHR